MPRIIVTEGAARGIERCRRFLARNSGPAARRAAEAIQRSLLMLETRPEIGRPFAEDRDLRELVIGFADSGHVALYRYEAGDDALYVLAFRHQREAGY